MFAAKLAWLYTLTWSVAAMRDVSRSWCELALPDKNLVVCYIITLFIWYSGQPPLIALLARFALFCILAGFDMRTANLQLHYQDYGTWGKDQKGLSKEPIQISCLLLRHDQLLWWSAVCHPLTLLKWEAIIRRPPTISNKGCYLVLVYKMIDGNDDGNNSKCQTHDENIRFWGFKGCLIEGCNNSG